MAVMSVPFLVYGLASTNLAGGRVRRRHTAG